MNRFAEHYTNSSKENKSGFSMCQKCYYIPIHLKHFHSIRREHKYLFFRLEKGEFHSMWCYLNCIELIFIYVSLGLCSICEFKNTYFPNRVIISSACHHIVKKKKKRLFPLSVLFFFDGWKGNIYFTPWSLRLYNQIKRKIHHTVHVKVILK